MNRQEIITRFCALASRVGSKAFYHELDHDCFCESEFSSYDPCCFRFDESVLEFIEKAVNDALTRIQLTRGDIMRCPICKRWNVYTIVYHVCIPGGIPPMRNICDDCGWSQEVPAVYPKNTTLKGDTSPE